MARRGRPRKAEPVEKYAEPAADTANVAEPTPADATATTISQVIVDELEREGAVKYADKVRDIAGLPPRRLSRAEEFVREVERQVTGGPVYFHADTPEEALEWVALAKELPYPKPNLKYHARVTTPPTRIEVSLVGG